MLKEEQPKGVYWGGHLDRGRNVIISEAWFRLRRVSDIRETYLSTQGNLKETSKQINRDIGSDEEIFIKPEEIILLVDWASRNTIYATHHLTDG